MNHRVVITGLGICSALGSGIETFWHALTAGQSGIKAASNVGTPAPVPAGFVPDLPPWEATRRAPDRMIQLSHTAVGELFAQQVAPIDPSTALFWGTGYTAMGTIEACFEAWFLHDRVRADTVPACMPTSVLAHLCNHFGLRGMSTLVSASCASGLNAIGTAFYLLQQGIIQSALVGSADAPLTPGMFRAWRPLKVLAQADGPAERACRPFSADRTGLVLAEGAGALLLETLEHAQARGVPILGEIGGFYATTSGGSIVAPDVDQQALTVQHLLNQAKLEPSAIDYINAHATATRLGDTAETTTIKTVFGTHASKIPISAIKGATGHAMGASSTLETIATVLALHHQSIPPTINWSAGDPSCDLDYVTEAARPARLRLAIKESFGFGGANAALLLRAIDDLSTPSL